MGIGSGHAIDLRLTCQRFRHTCAADAVACAVLIVNEERSTSVTETFFRLFSAHFTVRAWFLPPVRLLLPGLLHSNCSICRLCTEMKLLPTASGFIKLHVHWHFSNVRLSAVPATCTAMCKEFARSHHNNEKHASESQVDMADMQITHPFSGVLGLSRRCLGAGPHTAEESHGQRSPAPCHSDLSAEAAAQEARRHAFSGSYHIGRCRCCCPPRPSICRSS